MSIGNKVNLLVMMTVMLCVFTASASAFSIRVLEGGIPIVDPHQMVEDGLRLGNADLLRQAWKHYEDSVVLPTGIGSGYLELGRIYFYLSLLGDSTETDYELAERFARQAISDNPQNADAHHALGLILAGRGAFLDAFEELTLALHLNPTNEFLLVDLASLHLALHQPVKTIEYLEGRSHKNGWAFVVLAMAWSQQNQKGKAILNLLKARKMGYGGYWIDTMLAQFAEEFNLPFK
ncbi:MAG: hypothetical protein PHD82_14205 [Candidatus Riflebacteria bacterium]|jgi:tetratricopeptide (TPR) repeat protein|nr:hypothetical protein [Candidatus Riflebacteria bacterium]